MILAAVVQTSLINCLEELGVLVGTRYALIGGYRYLNVNYNQDDFLFDMALHGPVFGLGIKF